jgi:tRNA-specific 2-thiouridylase
MKNRVVVAMSGGVDSSVAAAILQAKGFEVIGLTMCLNLAEAGGRRPACCGVAAIEDARRVAHKLGIRHYVVNMGKALEEKVIADFLSEYLAGRTPNPCVRCNQFIKFGVLLEKALSLGAQYLATGHYARIRKVEGQRSKVKGYTLCKARDARKDQSYFLYRLTQQQLRHTFFPVGDYTKPQVRALAKKFSLPVAEKPESQEICFVPQDDYRAFLRRRCPAKLRPGSVLDSSGKEVGRHAGIALYTIGQREGLGIALGYPAYIIKIDPRRNAISVGRKEEAFSRALLVKAPHFILAPPKKKVALQVKIRYNHRQSPAVGTPLKGRLLVSFEQPQFAVSPGQSAVFYRGETVIGGGIIERALDYA